MKQIPLSKGKFAIVDDDDYKWLNQWKWHFKEGKYGGYAARNRNGHNRITIRMHRIIMNTPENMDTDHINHNTLDNRRCNLRICTRSQNLANRKICHNNKSGIKGVCWGTRDKKWRAQIRYQNKVISLGYYDNVDDAANAYKFAAQSYFGAFAYIE